MHGYPNYDVTPNVSDVKAYAMSASGYPGIISSLDGSTLSWNLFVVLPLIIDSSGAVCFSSDFSMLPMLTSHVPYAVFR